MENKTEGLLLKRGWCVANKKELEDLTAKYELNITEFNGMYVIRFIQEKKER